MDFQEMEIRKSYISYGDETIAKALVGPAMERAVLYQRSVGFFSASVLQTIMGSIPRFVKNGGRIQLVSSPHLRQEDHDAIALGYEMRKSIINQRFSEDFSEQIEMLSTPDLQILAEMIGHGILDIKIVITRQAGIYHDKLGILHDKEGNVMVKFLTKKML